MRDGSLIALVALGAFHGLNPGMGWLFAVGRGLQERSRALVLQALPAIEFYLAHRRERLEQVRAAVEQLRAEPHPEGIAAEELPRRVVEIVYADVDPVLWGAAELSVRAQLAYLG